MVLQTTCFPSPLPVLAIWELGSEPMPWMPLAVEPSPSCRGAPGDLSVLVQATFYQLCVPLSTLDHLRGGWWGSICSTLITGNCSYHTDSVHVPHRNIRGPGTTSNPQTCPWNRGLSTQLYLRVKPGTPLGTSVGRVRRMVKPHCSQMFGCHWPRGHISYTYTPPVMGDSLPPKQVSSSSWGTLFCL